MVRIRIRVRIRFSVRLVSFYAHVSVLVSIVIADAAYSDSNSVTKALS